MALLDARIARWGQEAAPGAPSGGPRPGGNRPAVPGWTAWEDWGPTKAQQAANTRFPAEDAAANLQRFVAASSRIRKYADYRQMFEQQKDIDAVIVATPDHMHAVIASAAMDLGKHVYVQKPMAWSVSESRHLARRAAETKVQAQCGNQRHSNDENRRGVDFITSGVIGDVTQIHVWTNRPIWPQGIPRPATLTAEQRAGRISQQSLMQAGVSAMASTAPPPSTLSWDLFLGVAPVVEYSPLYHPFNWRGWVDWGQGALGDMGAHLIDFPVWALDLDLPTTVETTSTPFNDITFPLATMTHYDFPAKGRRPAVRMTWYDGGFTPPTPEELEGDARLVASGGILYIGTKGKLLCNEGMPPRLLPASLAQRDRRTEGTARTRAAPGSRDELDSRHQGAGHAVEPVLVRGAPARDHAARPGVAAGQVEDPLRRRKHARDQQRQREPVPHAGIQEGLVEVRTQNAERRTPTFPESP